MGTRNRGLHGQSSVVDLDAVPDNWPQEEEDRFLHCSSYIDVH
jgi:hypothetical protein